MTREEAIKIVKEFINGTCLHLVDQEALETLIPELKESKDEKVRKEIIEVLQFVPSSMWEQAKTNYKRCFAYLEKWKKLFESGRGLYYYDGEKTIYCGYPALEENPYDFAMDQQEKQKEPHYTKRNALFDKCVKNCDPEVMKKVSDEVDEMLEKEQKPNFDTYLENGSMVCEQKEQRSVGWSEEDEKVIGDACCWIAEYAGYLIDKNYGKASMLMSLSEKLKFIRPRPKQEWSKEDEKNLGEILGVIYEASCGIYRPLERDRYKRWESWLKSLRPSWKPSEEQIQSLKQARDYYMSGCIKYVGRHLSEIAEQLEKLM